MFSLAPGAMITRRRRLARGRGLTGLRRRVKAPRPAPLPLRVGTSSQLPDGRWVHARREAG